MGHCDGCNTKGTTSQTCLGCVNSLWEIAKVAQEVCEELKGHGLHTIDKLKDVPISAGFENEE